MPFVESKKIELNTKEMIEQAKACSIFEHEKTPAIRFEMQGLVSKKRLKCRILKGNVSLVQRIYFSVAFVLEKANLIKPMVTKTNTIANRKGML